MVLLWASNGGHIACDEHLGMYGQSERRAHPRARRLITPLDVWERLTDADNDEWIREFGEPMRCESCRCGRG
jgi:hypothetical protein